MTVGPDRQIALSRRGRPPLAVPGRTIFRTYRERNADGAVARGVDRGQAAGRYAFCRRSSRIRTFALCARAGRHRPVLQPHGQESPPENTPTRNDMSSFSNPVARSRASNTVGTPGIKFGCFCAAGRHRSDVEIRHEDEQAPPDERRVDADAEAAEAVEHGHDGRASQAADAFSRWLRWSAAQER